MRERRLPVADAAPVDTRGRILATARELFADRGYQHTSLREIGQRLGLTKAAILYHFPTKEHLLIALVEPLLGDLEEVLTSACRLPPERAGWVALEGYLDTMLRHRRALGMLAHDIALLSRGRAYRRLMDLAKGMNVLVAGEDADRRDRVRAVQAVAMLSDPVVILADIPAAQLRDDMLDGLRRLLPDLDPDTPTTTPPRGAADGGAADGGAADGGAADGGAADGGAADGGAGRRRRGVGRPRAMSEERVAAARRMYAGGAHTVGEIAASLGVSRATVYRHLTGQRSSHN